MGILSKSVLAVTVLAVTFGGTAAALAGGTFTVKNRNKNVSIQQVWFAHTGERNDPWKEARLNYAIAPRTSSTFDISGHGCFYDIKVKFSDGYEGSFTNVNVCRGDSVLAD